MSEQEYRYAPNQILQTLLSAGTQKNQTVHSGGDPYKEIDEFIEEEEEP